MRVGTHLKCSISPCRYKDPAGPASTSSSTEQPSDPASMYHDLSRSWMEQLLISVETDYLRNFTHAAALCDLHLERIVGKWYRCAFCVRVLWADCESFDTHDGTHAFLVFKAPVDMHAYRCEFPHPCESSSMLTDNVPNRDFVNLDNPAGTSPPVFQGNIYYPRNEL